MTSWPVGAVSTATQSRSGRYSARVAATLNTSPVHASVCRSRAASSTERGSMSSSTITLVQRVCRSVWNTSRSAYSNRCMPSMKARSDDPAPQRAHRARPGEEVVARGLDQLQLAVQRGGHLEGRVDRDRARPGQRQAAPVVHADLEVGPRPVDTVQALEELISVQRSAPWIGEASRREPVRAGGAAGTAGAVAGRPQSDPDPGVKARGPRPPSRARDYAKEMDRGPGNEVDWPFVKTVSGRRPWSARTQGKGSR